MFTCSISFFTRYRILKTPKHRSYFAFTGPTTAPPPQCSESFDLVFAMDSSGSIGKDNYQKEKNFINGLANKLVVGPRNVHLGLIVFSDSSIVWLNFGTPTSTNYSSFSEAAVDNAPYLRGRTRIDSALQTAGDVFPEGRQNQEPQVLILITDGRQSNDPGSVPLKTAVQPLRDQGVKVRILVFYLFRIKILPKVRHEVFYCSNLLEKHFFKQYHWLIKVTKTSI